MMTSDKSRFSLKIFGALTLFATIILFFISTDSYTRDMYGHWDSNWFFMCGKALMEGMTPYVDFTDSKGLLLWIIYGLGYLISPSNNLGVFWLSCLAYGGIFYLVWLTARVFINDKRRAMVCTILMGFAFFNVGIHYETRAEDFCLLFVMWTLYRTVRILYLDDMERKSLVVSFFIMGLSFGALLMIKFNIAVMQSIFILYAAYHLIRRRVSLWRPFFALCVGFLIVVVPLVAFMLYRGCLDAFIQEYFINTVHTVSTGKGIVADYVDDWIHSLQDKYSIILFVAIVAGSILYARRLPRYKTMPLVTSLFFFAITTRHSLWIYYYMICSFCLIWLFLWVADLECVGKVRRRLGWLAAVVAVVCIAGGVTVRNDYKNMFWNNGKDRKKFYEMQYLMSRIEHPTLINVFCSERGIGVVAKALPGGKYWAQQNGLTKEMLQREIDDILSGKADFLYLDHANKVNSHGLSMEKLEKAGYHECYRFGDSRLYSKHDVKLPEKSVVPSNMDILLKRLPAAFYE